MICSICNEQGYPMSPDRLDPPEPCLCGQLAWGSPYRWNGWRGVRDYLRYRLAAACFTAGNRLISPRSDG